MLDGPERTAPEILGETCGLQILGPNIRVSFFGRGGPFSPPSIAKKRGQSLWFGKNTLTPIFMLIL